MWRFWTKRKYDDLVKISRYQEMYVLKLKVKLTFVSKLLTISEQQQARLMLYVVQTLMFTKLTGEQVASHKNAPIEELHKPKYSVFNHKMVVLFKDLGLLNPGEDPAGLINNISDLVNHLCNS